MTQPELPFDDTGHQLSFEEAFKDAWHNSAGNIPLSRGSTPIAAGHGEYETISINDDDNLLNSDEPNPSHIAAPITLVPTSTTNPMRPRTVAAGYDPKTKTLTVLFRMQGRADDGDPYNYYDVPNLVWQNFKRARSKGRFILTYLDSQPRGFAEASAVTDFAHAALSAISTQQQAQGGFQPEQVKGSKRGDDYGSGHLGGTGRARRAQERRTAAYWEAMGGRFGREGPHR